MLFFYISVNPFAFRKPPPPREMREVIVFDRTHSFTSIKLWDFDWIHLADDWQPKKTVNIIFQM